ncbi:MAG TPA: acyltransferase [Gemmataceae bacterium]|nr:acyltransferase [Gemmataceae bacterium]
MSPSTPVGPTAPVASGAPRLPFIDALRGLACLGVIFCHVHAYWLNSFRSHGWNFTTLVTRVAGWGGKGVDLFIVLSGFCLFWPVVRKGPTLPLETGKFYRRRARRILPVYYAGLVLCTALVLVPVLQPMLVARPIRLSDIMAYLFLVQPFSTETIGSINGSYWSLSLEVQLYLVFPLLLILARRMGLRAVIAVGAGAAMVSEMAILLATRGGHKPQWAALLPAHLPACWILFICGMLAARLVSRPLPGQARKAALLAAALLPICVPLQPLGPRFAVVDNALWGVLFACVVIAAASVPPSAFIRYSRLGFLTWIGTISYSLYVLHQPALLLSARLVQSLHLPVLATFAVATPLWLVPAIGLAYLFFTRFERPFMGPARGPRSRTAEAPDTCPAEASILQT